MEHFASCRRIVVKLGTQIVVHEDGSAARRRLAGLAGQMARLRQDGRSLLLVSSGAVGLGRRALHMPPGELSLVEKQACAAVGQGLLMQIYRELFQNHGLTMAQVLLSAGDFAHRQRYLTLHRTLEKLLDMGVLPIINENDTVSTEELEEEAGSLGFGDNDRLSALVAGKLSADLLVILTDVDGIYTDNPREKPSARRLERIDDFSQLSKIRSRGHSAYGRGGMSAKIEAARVASISGVPTWVTSGLGENTLAPLLDPKTSRPGTLVLAQSTLRGRRPWIGFASGTQGTLVVNSGARQALVERQASLLSVGIVSVEGHFKPGQVVSVQDQQGFEVGRGVTRLSSEQIERVKGLDSASARGLLGQDVRDETIHRDDLVIFQEHFPATST
ncbi:MAG TPA: glutamate 5-kinase [Acidobacteriota bacterium]|nr:glutamate 5-kinase [Acidobacteriota bacterium]